MSDRNRNRPDSKKSTDEWLSPPRIIELAGPFDLDPACAPRMPWRTAELIISNGKTGGVKCEQAGWVKARVGSGILPGDGLATDWNGRVWLNPPYSDILPWSEKMAAHGCGMMLVPAKSTDTQWAQCILETADRILFFAGRLLFHYPNGAQSEGAWGPSMLAAWGEQDVDALFRVKSEYPGIIYKRTS